MVFPAKMKLQHAPSGGHASALKIQNFTVAKKQSIMKASYGTLLVVIAVMIAAINPVELATNWLLNMKEGSFLYHIWENPLYELYSEVWTYNYTNVQEFLNGDDKVLKLQEVGPFVFREVRTNENVTIDEDRGVMTMRPKIDLHFVPDMSFSELNATSLHVPNIALIAISTLAADKLGYFVNTGAYISISALGVNLFRNLTVNELLWGYHDPIVSIANGLLPGWIDFGKLGILDRFYAPKPDLVEIEIKNNSNRFSIRTWNDSPGLTEQGFTDLNTSTPCNLIKGTYEGFMLPANFPKGQGIPLFRKQACRVYPFDFHGEVSGVYGYNFYRYTLAKSAFSKDSPYACNCEMNCLPEGFVDVSQCYYGFPIALSKPHFLDVDEVQQSNYEGMHPDPVKHTSHIDLEPTIGAPLALESNIQVNIAVRTSSGNPITMPLKDKVLPLVWLSMSCKQPPSKIATLLYLRLVVGPPLVITIEVLFFTIGIFIGIHGFYRVWRPRYSFMETNQLEEQKLGLARRESVEKHSVTMNIGDQTLDDDDFMKQAVLLLSMDENDNDVDLVKNDKGI